MTLLMGSVEAEQLFFLVPGQSMVIGRGPQSDIILDMMTISRQNTEVHWEGCRVWVHDLGSRCGTNINGEHFRDGVRVVEPAGSLLRLGDILRPGPVRFL